MRTKRLIYGAAVVALVLAAGCGKQSHIERKRDEARERWAVSRAEMVTKLARGEHEKGNFARARQQLDPLIRSSTPYAPAYVLSARLAADQGHLDEALGYACTATATDENLADAWYVRGTIEQTLGDPQAALNAYGKASSLEPADSRYVMAEAEMLVATEHVDGAATCLAGACSRLPGSAELHAALGDVRSRQSQYAEAAGLYRIALRLDPTNTAPRERLAIALFRSGAYAEAEPLLADLQASEPDFAIVWVCQMRADCLLALRRVEAAQALYQERADAAPDEAAPWVGLARCDILRDRLPEARRHLEEALARRPRHAEANGLIGYVLTATGRPGEAVPHLRLAMKDPACTDRDTIERLLAHAEEAAVTRTP